MDNQLEELVLGASGSGQGPAQAPRAPLMRPEGLALGVSRELGVQHVLGAAIVLVLEAGIHHRHTPGRMGESGGGGDGTLESVSQWAEEISSQKRQQGLRASEGHIPPWLNSWSVLMEKKDPEFLDHQNHSSPHTCVPHHSAQPV